MLDAFREIVLVDFEFAVTPGNRPQPVCLVAHELRSGRQFQIWQDQFAPAPPYATGPDVLFVAYYASAELGCCRVLGWPMPERVLDLFCEFRARTNGLDTPAAMDCSAPWPISASTPWARARRPKCGISYCGAAGGRRRSASPSSTTARAMSSPWNGYCPSWCRGLICRGHYC